MNDDGLTFERVDAQTADGRALYIYTFQDDGQESEGEESP